VELFEMKTVTVPVLFLQAACGAESGTCEVGFWETADCSGDPVATNSFPIDASTTCQQDIPPTIYAMILDNSACE
jgi:hypothetical protein